MSKKGYDKFHFVEAEEETDTTDQESRLDQNKRLPIYIDFKVRVIILVFVILTLFTTGCIFTYKALSFSEIKEAEYVENTSTKYKICSITEDQYLSNCTKTYNGKLEDVKNVKVEYDYSALVDSASKIDLTYYIVAINRVYDKFDSSRVLYENEDIIVDKTPIAFKKGQASVQEDYSLNIKRYNEEVIDYQRKYIYASNAILEIRTYIINNDNKYIASTINIPLGTEEFTIYNNDSENVIHKAKVEIREWTSYETALMVVGSVLMFVSLVVLFILTTFVSRAINKKSKYETKLNNILTTYDKYILYTREGYVNNDSNKKEIKLTTFEDLLDARDILDRPILFSKINNVKSEFIVEDYDKIYKYILKEVDVEKE